MAKKASSHEKTRAGRGGSQGEGKKTADGIPVHCHCDALVLVQDLKRHPLNYRVHPKKQRARYKQVVEGSGWRRAVVVSKRSGVITKGHGALETAQECGWKELPVEYQDYENEAAELADIAADNFLATLGGDDRTKLRTLLARLQGEEMDLALTGMPEEDLQHLVATLEKEELILPVELASVTDEGGEKKGNERVPETPVKSGGTQHVLGLVLTMELQMKWKRVKDSFHLKEDLPAFKRLVEARLESS